MASSIDRREEALKFKRLYEDQGWTTEAIALEHGRSTQTVRNRLLSVDTQMRLPNTKAAHGAKQRKEKATKKKAVAGPQSGHVSSKYLRRKYGG